MFFHYKRHRNGFTNEFTSDCVQNCLVFLRLKHGHRGVVGKENAHSKVGSLDSIRFLEVDGSRAGPVFDAALEDVCEREFLSR